MNIYRLLLIILSLISAWLYLRVVLPPESAAPALAETTRDTDPAQAVSRVAAEISDTASATPSAIAPEAASKRETLNTKPVETTAVAPQTVAPPVELQPLPADQMRQVIETLAPELLGHKP